MKNINYKSVLMFLIISNGLFVGCGDKEFQNVKYKNKLEDNLESIILPDEKNQVKDSQCIEESKETEPKEKFNFFTDVNTEQYSNSLKEILYPKKTDSLNFTMISNYFNNKLSQYERSIVPDEIKLISGFLKKNCLNYENFLFDITKLTILYSFDSYMLNMSMGQNLINFCEGFNIFGYAMLLLQIGFDEKYLENIGNKIIDINMINAFCYKGFIRYYSSSIDFETKNKIKLLLDNYFNGYMESLISKSNKQKSGIESLIPKANNVKSRENLKIELKKILHPKGLYYLIHDVDDDKE